MPYDLAQSKVVYYGDGYLRYDFVVTAAEDADASNENLEILFKRTSDGTVIATMPLLVEDDEGPGL